MGRRRYRHPTADNVVTISGKIELYKRKPEIVISSAVQMAKE